MVGVQRGLCVGGELQEDVTPGGAREERPPPASVCKGLRFVSILGWGCALPGGEALILTVQLIQLRIHIRYEFIVCAIAA